jgi:hypothetical protein
MWAKGKLVGTRETDLNLAHRHPVNSVDRSAKKKERKKKWCEESKKQEYDKLT